MNTESTKNATALIAAVSVVLATVVDVLLVSTVLQDVAMWLQGVICVVLFLSLFFIISWGYYAVQAVKDPDVQEASYLRMSITHYKRYKAWWQELGAIYDKYGLNSPESLRRSDEVIKKIMRECPNMNEWRRFGERQEELSTMETERMIDDLRNNKFEDG